MKEHTPGPWSIHPHSPSIGGGAHINGPHNCAIAYVGFGTETPDHYVTGPEADANAHLIAAAPDLLAALQHLSGLYDAIWVKMSDGEMSACRAAWDRAEAAIAKARAVT